MPILNSLDGKVVQPSMDMKKALENVQKMVKKRHHKKMDFDRVTASVRFPLSPVFRASREKICDVGMG